MLAPCPALTRTLLQSPKPAKLDETLSPPSARTSESTLNMIARCAEHRVRVHMNVRVVLAGDKPVLVRVLVGAPCGEPAVRGVLKLLLRWVGEPAILGFHGIWVLGLFL